MSESENHRSLKERHYQVYRFAPDCSWELMTTNSPMPEGALFQNGELNGDKVYVGRVHDGKCVYVGTAIPNKGICMYLNKDLEIKSSENYEILTIGSVDSLWFVEASSMAKGDYDQFIGGIDESDELLYVGRHVDAKYNTYYGWLFKDFEKIFVPREEDDGAKVFHEGFSILIHRYISRMCTGCPMPVKGIHYF